LKNWTDRHLKSLRRYWKGLPYRTNRRTKKVYPITVQRVINVNKKVLKLSEYPQDIENLSRLERLVTKINTEKTIRDKAAQILWGIAADQNFLEGNKRTALFITFEFLKTKGYHLKVDKEVEDFLWNTARGLTTLEQAKELLNRKIALI
jgi:death-on-curing family protein